MYNVAGFIALLLISLGLTLAIWAALAKSLEGVLNQVMKLPDGTTFYLRIFLVGLLLAGAAGGIGTQFDLKPDANFMEYVWKVASGLEGVFGFFFGFLLAYLLMVTVLVAVLRSRHEQ